MFLDMELKWVDSFDTFMEEIKKAKYEYRHLRRALDKAELIIRRGEKKW